VGRAAAGGGAAVACTAVTARCPTPVAGGQSRAARARGRRSEGRGLGGLFGNFKNLRDFSIKQDFPLI
jgi:hypothetical protein